MSNLSQTSGTHAGPLVGVKYSPSEFRTEQVAPKELGAWATGSGVCWFDVQTPNAAGFAALQEQLGLHPLAVSDAAHPPQRPHHAAWPEFELLMLSAPAPEGGLQQVSLFLGEGWVLSIRESAEDLFAPVREQLEAGIGPLREGSASLLAVALVSTVVDGLFQRAEGLREQVEDLEEEVIDGRARHLNQRLHRFRRQLLHLRRVVEPTRDTLRRAAQWATQRWAPDAQVHLREEGEDAEQLFELVMDAQSSASSLVDLNLAMAGGRTHMVVTMLTVVSTVFLPMTFLASMWGMNFKHMPELDWRWGYPLALAVILLSAALPMVWMVRQQWFRSLRGLWAEEQEEEREEERRRRERP